MRQPAMYSFNNGYTDCKGRGAHGMTRPKHPNKDIEKALRYSEEKGWRVAKSQGGTAHPWGRIYCPLQSREGCRMSVWSTPKNPTNHAKQIRRIVNLCGHILESDDEYL